MVLLGVVPGTRRELTRLNIIRQDSVEYLRMPIRGQTGAPSKKGLEKDTEIVAKDSE